MARSLNLDLIRRTLDLVREGLTHEDIAEKLGRNTRTIDNYASAKWLAARNLGHLTFPEQELRIPRSTLENEAWGLCRSGDHEWMDDARFDGHAYNVEDVSEPMTGHGGSRLINIREVRTCHYCGYEAVPRKRRGFVIV